MGAAARVASLAAADRRRQQVDIERLVQRQPV
jgi:hypothetical protein